MKTLSKIALFALTCGTFVFISCSDNDDNATTPAQMTLYQKLGGTSHGSRS